LKRRTNDDFPTRREPNKAVIKDDSNDSKINFYISLSAINMIETHLSDFYHVILIQET